MEFQSLKNAFKLASHLLLLVPQAFLRKLVISEHDSSSFFRAEQSTVIVEVPMIPGVLNSTSRVCSLFNNMIDFKSLHRFVTISDSVFPGSAEREKVTHPFSLVIVDMFFVGISQRQDCLAKNAKISVFLFSKTSSPKNFTHFKSIYKCRNI